MKYKEMSIWGKVLFVLAVIAVVGAHIVLILSVLAMLGIATDLYTIERLADQITKHNLTLSEDQATTYSAYTLCVMSIVSVLIGWIEVHTARGKINPLVLIVLGALNFIFLIGEIFEGNFDIGQILPTLWGGAELVCLIMLYKERKGLPKKDEDEE